MKRIWLILAAIMGLTASAVPASADLLFTLNQGGSAFSTPGTYGTVNLHQVGSGSSAYVTVTVSLAAGYTFAGTGAGYAIAWDITGDPSLSSVAVTSSNHNNFTVQNYHSGHHYMASPFTSGGGSCSHSPYSANCFNYAIDYDLNGSTGSDTSFVFDVKKSGGLLLTNFAANPNGYYFAVDISGNCTSSYDSHKHKYVTTCDTGNVASNGPPVQVPEPKTWLLFIAGLAALPLLQRRRKLAKA